MFKALDKMEEGYPRVNNFVLLLFSGYVVIWYLQIGNRFPDLGAIRLEFWWAIILIIIALLQPNKPKYMDNPLGVPIVLLFLVMTIQVPLSYVPDYSWNVFFNRVVKFAFMAFFIVSFVRSPKGLAIFITSFMLACMKMGQEGFLGYLTGSMMWENQGVMRLHGSTPNYMHPNSFTGMALGTIPFIIYLFPVVPRWVKVLLVIQLVFALNIVLHTGSRTGYVAFSILLVVWWFQSKRKATLMIWFVIAGLVLLPFVDSQYVARFETMVTGQEIEGNSMGKRVEIIEDSLAVLIDNPFGVGVSAFPAVRMSRFGRFQDTHNLYLEVATNLGIQGLIIFLFFVYRIFRINRYALIKNESNSNFIYFVLKATFLFFIVRLCLGLFGMDLYEIYWWFVSGIYISIYNILESKKNSDIERGIC